MSPQEISLLLTHRPSASTAVLLLTLLLCRGYCQDGPVQQIVALLGDDAVLPCFLKTPVDASDMQLEWARTDLAPGFIYVWEKNKENVELKQPPYVGRTSLSSDRLKHGDVSLTLSKVQLSDEGPYRCFIPQLGQRSHVDLVVGSVSAPVIKVISNHSSRLVLQCESAGWYPEPELLWLDGEGNLLSVGPTETLRGPDDLYTVSSRVTVEKRHSNNITCRVQQKNINQSRETHTHVPEDFFEVQFTLFAVIIGLALCIILLILASVLLVCIIRRNINTKRTFKDCGDAPTEESRETKKLMEKEMQHQQEKQRNAGTAETWKQPHEEKQKMEEAKKQIKELQTKIEKMEKELQDKKQGNVGLVELHNQLQEEKKKFETKIKELETKISEMEKELQQEKQRNVGAEETSNQGGVRNSRPTTDPGPSPDATSKDNSSNYNVRDNAAAAARDNASEDKANEDKANEDNASEDNASNDNASNNNASAAAASDPAASDPAASDPAAAASDPGASDPTASDPGASDPTASNPGASDPAPATRCQRPGASDPVPATRRQRGCLSLVAAAPVTNN